MRPFRAVHADGCRTGDEERYLEGQHDQRGGGQHSMRVSSSAQSSVPQIYPVSGFYTAPQMFTIISRVAGAKIFFT